MGVSYFMNLLLAMAVRARICGREAGGFHQSGFADMFVGKGALATAAAGLREGEGQASFPGLRRR